MAFRPLHWATEMLSLIDMSGYEGEALAEQGMDGSLQRRNQCLGAAWLFPWMRIQTTDTLEHDSAVKLTTNLGKRNAKTLEALENPLSASLLYEGSRLPLIPHLCCILVGF